MRSTVGSSAFIAMRTATKTLKYGIREITAIPKIISGTFGSPSSSSDMSLLVIFTMMNKTQHTMNTQKPLLKSHT